MSNNKKTLLNENTIRRMMKLASVDTLSDSFISTKYAPLNEKHQGYDDKEDERMGMEDGPEKDKKVSMKGRRDDKYGKFGKRDKEDRKDARNLEEETNENESVNEEEEIEAAEIEVEDSEGEEEVREDEVTLTDDEAREIIALADKLRAAMGDTEEVEDAMDAMDDAEDKMDSAMDAMDDAEDEMDIAMDEEPGMRDSMIAEKKDDLYEAALKGLNIEISEDRAVKLENLKKSCL
jgi:hypothetical protein